MHSELAGVDTAIWGGPVVDTGGKGYEPTGEGNGGKGNGDQVYEPRKGKDHCGKGSAAKGKGNGDQGKGYEPTGKGECKGCEPTGKGAEQTPAVPGVSAGRPTYDDASDNPERWSLARCMDFSKPGPLYKAPPGFSPIQRKDAASGSQ